MRRPAVQRRKLNWGKHFALTFICRKKVQNIEESRRTHKLFQKNSTTFNHFHLHQLHHLHHRHHLPWSAMVCHGMPGIHFHPLSSCLAKKLWLTNGDIPSNAHLYVWIEPFLTPTAQSKILEWQYCITQTNTMIQANTKTQTDTKTP